MLTYFSPSYFKDQINNQYKQQVGHRPQIVVGARPTPPMRPKDVSCMKTKILQF